MLGLQVCLVMPGFQKRFTYLFVHIYASVCLCVCTCTRVHTCEAVEDKRDVRDASPLLSPCSSETGFLSEP